VLYDTHGSRFYATENVSGVIPYQKYRNAGILYLSEMQEIFPKNFPKEVSKTSSPKREPNKFITIYQLCLTS